MVRFNRWHGVEPMETAIEQNRWTDSDVDDLLNEMRQHQR